MPTIAQVVRNKMKGRAWEISQATDTSYRVAREFLLETRDPKVSTIDKWCAYLGLKLIETESKTKSEKGQRRARPSRSKRNKPK
jgi:hypothetical protein